MWSFWSTWKTFCDVLDLLMYFIIIYSNWRGIIDLKFCSSSAVVTAVTCPFVAKWRQNQHYLLHILFNFLLEDQQYLLVSPFRPGVGQPGLLTIITLIQLRVLGLQLHSLENSGLLSSLFDQAWNGASEFIWLLHFLL